MTDKSPKYRVIHIFLMFQVPQLSDDQLRCGIRGSGGGLSRTALYCFNTALYVEVSPISNRSMKSVLSLSRYSAVLQDCVKQLNCVLSRIGPSQAGSYTCSPRYSTALHSAGLDSLVQHGPAGQGHRHRQAQGAGAARPCHK